MIRVNIVVEGRTEESFVKQVLYPGNYIHKITDQCKHCFLHIIDF